ncbi:MAG: hypothetical protein JO086_01600 [Acidimicrobiia bacterium]|nr:hypothetical protein [Acidimicrobiia bacterium]
MKLGSARITALIVVIVAAVAGLAGLGTASSAQTCTYPFDSCTTTTVAPPSTTPGATTTAPPTTQPGQTTSTVQGATTTTAAGQTPPSTSLFDPCTLTPNGPVNLIFSIDPTTGSPGTQVVVNVQGVPPGTTVDITFNGSVVGTTTVPGQLGTPGCPAAAGSFAVPAVDPGTYLVCAVAAGAPTKCVSFVVPTSVLGTSFTRGGAPLVSATNPNSFLAFTGLGLVRLLLLAAVLIVAGWFLARRGQRRPAPRS